MTEIDDVRADQQSYYGSGNPEYRLTITGWVRNKTTASVTLRNFEPVTVRVGYREASVQLFPDEIYAGSSVSWSATATWSGLPGERPNVTAKALNWEWSESLLDGCAAGPSF